MKTFALFGFIWLVIELATFNMFKNGSDRELILFTLGTVISYVFYKLIKEETTKR